MMLAETGYLEILTESFRRQRLDDTTLKDECYDNLRSALEIQSHKISTHKSIFNNSKEKIAKEVAKNSTNIENCKSKISTVSTEISKPLKVNEKDQKTCGEKPEKFNASSNEINSCFKGGKSRVDKPEGFQEVLSSSEEELRELCSELNKTFHTSKEIEIPRVIPQESPVVSPRRSKNGKICNTKKQIVEIDKDVCRKRYKTTQRSFKKN